jgi:hypothetical protein
MYKLKRGNGVMPCTRIEMKQVPAAQYCIIDRAWLLGPAADGLYSFENTHKHTRTSFELISLPAKWNVTGVRPEGGTGKSSISETKSTYFAVIFWYFW